MRLPLALVIAVLASGVASAQVYKCRLGKGTTYQDKPCAKGTEIGRITLEAPPPSGKPASSSISLPKPARAPGPPVPPAPEALPIADNYQCTRHDGTTYFSASLMPKRVLVPAYAMAQPPKGVDPQQQLWVTDSCVAVPLQQACDFYALEIDRVQKLQRTAAVGEQKALQREALRLRTISNSRCRK